MWVVEQAVEAGVIYLVIHLMDCTHLGNKDTNVCIQGDYQVPSLIHGNCCEGGLAPDQDMF